ncbi:ComEC/Rec2 family competence protein [Nocardiopsis sp. MG754419]|uniref:ComEC/Rec2 family competence protein n=1 Tax=Nocardiopsis sp. MG754419 TaxID=2259865 RepID=UPI001BA44593|nr:ComEC/Rec2 family competence protein [Nocardiopsis sp. MG754419]MBR8744900.1 ComEC/Rec2 family competence protein [Nocardiopsis sp. MG754419]
MVTWLGSDGDGLGRPPDLRWVAPAAASWAAALVALAVPPWAAWSIAGGAVVVAASVALWRGPSARLGEAPIAVAVATLVCAATVAAVAGLHVHRTATSAAVAAAERGGEVEFGAVATVDPRSRAGMPRPGRAEWVVPARTTWVRVDGRVRASRASVVVLASGEDWSDLLPGQSFTARGAFLAAEEEPLTAALVAVHGPPEEVAEPGRWQAFAGAVRADLREAASGLPQPERGLFPALIVGDTSELREEVAEDFRATGMTHLLTVSGANLAVLTGFVLAVARWARAPTWCSVLGGAVMIWLFVLVCRPEPSVVRAAFMGSLGLLALATGRAHAGLGALCVTVVGVLFVAPGLATSYGFALSALATAGILLLVPGWTHAWSARLPVPLAEALAVAVAAHVAVAPVLVPLSGEVSWVAIPANVLAAPVVAVVTVTGSALAVLASVWSGAAALLVHVPGLGVSWIAVVAQVGARVPYGALPWRADVAGALLLAGLVAVFLLTRGRTRSVLAAVVVAVLVLGSAARCVPGGWPLSGWRLVACDVGQGDAFVLSTGRGEAVVFDTGDDPDLVDGCLERLGVREIPLLVLSHDHADHVDGTPGVLRHRRVGAALAPVGFADTPVGRLLAEEGVQPAVAERGQSFTVGTWTLRVLWPRAGYQGTVNDTSVVIRADDTHMSVLLTGDIEEPAQGELLRGPDAPLLAVTVLTTPHHGAGTQDPGFLAATGARVSVTSVGEGNPYGHPAPFTQNILERVARVNARTDRDGDVAVLDAPVRVISRGPAPDR